MGISFGSLSKIFLGVGLGILAVSCLTVTVLFGQFSNKAYTNLQKEIMKMEKSKAKSSLDASIAITVLGCISAVAAIAAIALSILLDGQTLILIIVGGVSALFAFGCIVAEGVFTKLQVDDQEDALDSRKSAQNYISGAIEDLYKHAYDTFSKEKDEVPKWKDDIEKKLGQIDSNDHVFTYSDIWTGESADESSDYITLSYRKTEYGSPDYDYIEARFSGCEPIIIASTRFTYEGKYAEKGRFCWYKKDYTDFSCKNMEIEKKENHPVSISSNNYDLRITEIVVTPNGYISNKKMEEEGLDVNYEIEDFPVAYIKLNPKDIDKNNLYDYKFEDSNNEYKVKGKKLAKANFKDTKKNAENPPTEKESYSYNLFLSPSEPKNYEDYYQNLCAHIDGHQNEYCRYYESVETIHKIIKYNYEDSNKGKIPPSVKKSLHSIQRNYLNKITESEYSKATLLYTSALINMIIQIFGIIFWACGRFLGFVLNGSDEKTASEGEA